MLAQKALHLSPLEVLSQGERALETFTYHKRFTSWAEARLQGKPLSRIVGQRDFWNHTFIINEHTLDPRPETEGLLEAILRLYPDKTTPLRFLELGVGSGCVLCSLLHTYPNAQGWGTDISDSTLQIAKVNAQLTGVDARVSFLQGSWCTPLKEGLKGTLDIAISNPPYIVSKVLETLAPGVKDYDPHLALDGGSDGLEAYRALLPQVRTFLKKEGALFLEVGHTQKKAVSNLAAPFFQTVATQRDLAGHDRILICRDLIV